MAPTELRLTTVEGKDHIARLYGFKQRDENGNPSPAAFILRPGEEFLSTVWLEHFHPTSRDVQVRGALAALRAKRTVGAKSRLAVMNVDDVLLSCARSGTQVIVKTTGEPGDPSHVGIYGYGHVNNEIAAVLARAVHHQIYSTVSRDV